jgi:hypothetical protein
VALRGSTRARQRWWLTWADHVFEWFDVVVAVGVVEFVVFHVVAVAAFAVRLFFLFSPQLLPGLVLC